MLDTAKLLNILQVIEKRAERIHNDEHTISTYVENEILTTSIAARDNGVIYGRRGTGKTHTLKYLAEKERAKGNLVVFIDVKQDLGSTGGGIPTRRFLSRRGPHVFSSTSSR
ncbi:helicase HerA-like domain-containing protein [Streptosporangium lutulentum]